MLLLSFVPTNSTRTPSFTAVFSLGSLKFLKVLLRASGSEGITESDFNTAKLAAMKAAELGLLMITIFKPIAQVNKNLVGAGCLTTEY
ncbi:arginine/serine-rich coiled-coil protein 2-like isoform X2 [Senna tora]|uniref:Arginine/serine-rich coiled-coil protein 2-like isoform X2 n=1 Tax=Senna tora TaxID=362788 RepID=A0A834W398_9FABA|nr:arginine/serine-rich coiled-coil protein 2-like isoform X2 [Senna tora]